MTASGTTVFIVDDEASVRRGLERLIRSAGWAVETYASAREFLDRYPASPTGCVILDVHMPEMNGTELHDRLCAAGVSLPVVFLTGEGDVPTSVRAMKRGAVDFLLKPVEADVLIGAIETAVARQAADLAAQAERHAIEQRVALLSAREREVLGYVIAGRLNKQIAAELGIAVKTVKVHRGRVMDKMQARSLADLVRLCETAGIAMRR